MQVEPCITALLEILRCGGGLYMMIILADIRLDPDYLSNLHSHWYRKCKILYLLWGGL